MLPSGLGQGQQATLGWCQETKAWGEAGPQISKVMPSLVMTPLPLQLTPRFSSASYIFGVTPVLGTSPTQV